MVEITVHTANSPGELGLGTERILSVTETPGQHLANNNRLWTGQTSRVTLIQRPGLRQGRGELRPEMDALRRDTDVTSRRRHKLYSYGVGRRDVIQV